MLGPDSKVVNFRSKPASLAQPSLSTTKIGATPSTGITPTRTCVWAKAGATATSAAKAAAARARKGRAMGCSGDVMGGDLQALA